MLLYEGNNASTLHWVLYLGLVQILPTFVCTCCSTIGKNPGTFFPKNQMFAEGLFKSSENILTFSKNLHGFAESKTSSLSVYG